MIGKEEGQTLCGEWGWGETDATNKVRQTYFSIMAASVTQKV